jgi:hypothetical protein
MAKQMSCNQVVARAIRKFGLPAVRAAVEMAVELSQTGEPTKRTAKPKTASAASSQSSSA